MNEFDKKLRKQQQNINQLLIEFLPQETSGYHEIVIEAMTYSLLAGGKRIRPMILEEVYGLFKPKSLSIEPFMVAIEMVHTYSLVHDDLPAMDNDDLRRGLPTCHKKYGENIAILAGDALLNRAYEIMLEGVMKYKLGDQGLLAASCLATNAGTKGIIGGQVADITYEDQEVDMDVIGYIHQHKTSALIEAAFMMGGYLAGQYDEVIKRLNRIGRCIGLAFQIQDDLLDITGDEAKLGKPILSDMKNKKTTYVDLKGVEGSKVIVADLLEEALSVLKSFDSNKTVFLRDFINYLKERTF
ncbi:MAG: polyprenyl synthetase family protein [Vallitaleaceae bacterium]|nr:polyprenyl synthetase family protein [Vallitaleaceae bacterium]